MTNLFGDAPTIKRKRVGLKALPNIPETGWRPPETLPNLSSAWKIGVDLETKDPELQDAGPGWARHRGHIIGASLAAVDHYGNRGKWYLPIRHEVGSEMNLDAQNVLAYLRHTLANPYQPKVFANGLYDLGWLAEEGVEVKGELNDVQFAQALINSNERSVALEALGQKYLGYGKTSDMLHEWIMEAYKPPPKFYRRELFRAPPSLVGPYAEDDALMPLDILQLQGPILDREELYNVYRLECDLMPMLVAMRMQGVHVNVGKAEELKAELELEIEAEYDALYKEYGFGLESTDSRQIAKLFDAVGVQYPRTKPSERNPDGNPSIEKEWLAALDHPLGDRLNELREREKMVGTFIQSYILDKNINGIIYPTFHPLKGEGGGTMLGRFASEAPNLQNIPTRTKLGKRVRAAFEPRPGRKRWRKGDYSQIHYRILAHYAVDKGDGSAERLRQAYRDNPGMDYHFNVYKDVAPVMGWSQDYAQTLNEVGELVYNEEIQDHRRVIKNINFSGLYGVGEKTVGYKYLIGMSAAQVRDFLTKYHAGAPYIHATMEEISRETERAGFVTTLLGRRIRFDMWEQRGFGKKEQPLPYNLAIQKWGSFIQLAYLYRAVNYKFQGSEPDIMKTGMLKLWKSGVLDYVGVPVITVHDELDWEELEVSPQMDEAWRFVKHTMEGAIPLRVPVKVDFNVGANWSKAK